MIHQRVATKLAVLKTIVSIKNDRWLQVMSERNKYFYDLSYQFVLVLKDGYGQVQ